ncbi:hypothetical protein MLD38_003311 [Melastoma candidum]|uniref:Uncharacterized protein n=1 Tax=Melastoma candidum TaxID=119954 RepID=A0ACB9S624_9MYRT|nr:hypothetical protein MLD38_003311 [Melastoma candidum]
MRGEMGENLASDRTAEGRISLKKQEIHDAVELPLLITSYTSRWAVANQTTAAFNRVVGSEFVQKYFGEGPRMVL